VSFKDPFDALVKEGFLSAVQQGELTLYNYANKCVFDGNWNEHTMAARGLVLDKDGRVMARPFTKFFNLNERPETKLEVLPKETPELSDKYDGSLIIAFWNSKTDEWQTVTRGCWNNVQTQYANGWIKVQGQHLNKEFTYLFELVAPWNRIVLLYRETKMVLTGVIHTETGEDWSYAKVRTFGESLGFDSVCFQSRPITDVNLADEGVTSEEGYVARFSNGFRVKLKYAQYLILHKILTGLSIKGIWELLSTGRPIDLSRVPDEFMDWFNEEKAKIAGVKTVLEAKAKEAFAMAPKCETRKEYAAHFTKLPQPLPAIMFRMLDKASYEELLWKHVKPEAHKTFQQDDGG